MNSAIKEKVDHLMETAEYEAVTVFDRCTAVMAQLETGEILMEACVSEDPEHYDQESGVEVCMRNIMSRVHAMVIAEAEAPAIPLTEDQAKTIVALAENNLQRKGAAADLYIATGTLGCRIDKIKKQTGKDPLNFFQMCELLLEARAVLQEA